MLISIKTVTGDRIDYHIEDPTEIPTLLAGDNNRWFTVVDEKNGQRRTKIIRVAHIVSVTVTDEP